MPRTVFTLTETADRTTYLLGVFTERAMAIDAAQWNAQIRAERCRSSHQKTSRQSVPAETYAVTIEEQGQHASVFIVHTPSGERECYSWYICPFELIEPSTTAETAQGNLSVITA